MNPYISKKITNAVKRIATDFPGVVFCGSLGLVLSGKLHRDVNDIDLHTDEDYFSQGGFYDEGRKEKLVASQKFKVGNNIIKCLSVIVEGVKVDAFYNDSLYSEDLETKNYYTISFEEIPIKVEKPEKAIEVKKQYIQTDRYGKGVLKHLRDLIEVGVDRKELIGIISKIKID